MSRGTTLQPREGKNRNVALAMASFLGPVALMALLLAAWRIAAEMQVATQFAIVDGPFSHWHVWGAIAFVVGVAAERLNRYGRGSLG
ncbi:MAG: hypothetical protein U0Q16_10595 [Bryobacteraceae bacterium]